MQSTSNERREVAERLRGLDSEITSRYTLEGAVDKFMTAVYGGQPFSPVSYSVRNLCGLCYALADLIDPTCGFSECPDNDELSLRIVSGYACRNCGHEAIVERCAGGWSEPPNYCPHCGCRLVMDE